MRFPNDDLRKNVLRVFGFFRTAQKLVVVLYYDYTGAASSDRFRQRAAALFSTVKVSEK